MREEAASWAEKLKGVGEVLDLWLETQDLWLDLEAVFSDQATSKELPQVLQTIFNAGLVSYDKDYFTMI